MGTLQVVMDRSRTGGYFALSLAAGLFLGLGVRSVFHEPPSMEPASAAPAAGAHHEDPGHGEHGHEGTNPAEDSTPGKKDAPARPDADAHGGHGGQVESPMEMDAGKGGLLLDLGNDKCPVMGGSPDGETFSEWNGLRVSHCCPACTGKFLSAPERFLDEAGIEWRGAAEAVEKVRASRSAERDRAFEEAAGKWTVLRRPAAEEAK